MVGSQGRGEVVGSEGRGREWWTVMEGGGSGGQ